MLKPYVYISTDKSKDVQREAPNGVRVAVHFPELGRSIELRTNGEGDYWLDDMPAPGHGGRTHRRYEDTLKAATPEFHERSPDG